jgi:hypothetical protein
MLKNTLILIGILSSSGIIHTMENNPLQRIIKSKQVTPFAGEIVAYTVCSYPKTVYTLPGSNLKYGHVDKKYSLRPLVKKNSLWDVTIDITDNYLASEHYSLCMRNITSQEAEKIIDALNSQEARFGDISTEPSIDTSITIDELKIKLESIKQNKA